MISPNSIFGAASSANQRNSLNRVIADYGSASTGGNRASAAASPATTGNGEAVGNPLLQILGSLQQTVSLMGQTLEAPGAGTTVAPNDLANAAIQNNQTQDPQQRQRMDETLAKLAQDPEGAKLLETALAKGYTLEVGDPEALGLFDQGGAAADAITCAACQQAALDGAAQDGAAPRVNGVTIPGQKRIMVNPDAPDFEKTLVHELVHAATEGDGNSQHEEGIADVIGFRVSGRITGEAPVGTPEQIYSSKIQNYPTLNRSNGIEGTLGQLGLSVLG